MSQLNFSTKALRTGVTPEINRASIQTPIFQTVSYVFESTDHAASVFNLSVATPIYTRLNNPTNGVLEQRLATLEGGIAAVVTASGQAALATTFLTILQSGDHLVSSSSIYGGSYNLLNHTLRKFGIHTTFVDSDDPSNYLSAIRPNTKAIFIESVGNPKLDVLDIEA
ncbi:MAG TPA: PLP-dependent transferase, partial [Saprospiraceae bacterium]|nr:PLP-dependent transferase [Saprospiraceae bacterium]